MNVVCKCVNWPHTKVKKKFKGHTGCHITNGFTEREKVMPVMKLKRGREKSAFADLSFKRKCESQNRWTQLILALWWCPCHCRIECPFTFNNSHFYPSSSPLNTSQVSRLSAGQSETIEVKSIDQASGKWIPSDAAETAKSEIAPEATGKVNTAFPLKGKSFAYWTRQHHDVGKPVQVGPFHLVKNNYHVDAGHQLGHGVHYTNGGFINHGQKVHHFLDDPSHSASLSHQVNPHSLVHTQFYHQNFHPFYPLPYKHRGQHHHHHHQQQHHHHQYHLNSADVSHTNDVNLGQIFKYQLKEQPIYHEYSHSHSHPHPGHNTFLHENHHRVTHGTSGYEVHAPNYVVWNYRN